MTDDRYRPGRIMAVDLRFAIALGEITVREGSRAISLLSSEQAVVGVCRPTAAQGQQQDRSYRRKRKRPDHAAMLVPLGHVRNVVGC